MISREQKGHFCHNERIDPHSPIFVAALPVYEAGLSIDRNDIPFRHANIIGWPDEDSAIKLAAIELAQKAELSLK